MKIVVVVVIVAFGRYFFGVLAADNVGYGVAGWQRVGFWRRRLCSMPL